MPHFLDLPAELIHMISEFLDDEYSINYLLQTNRRLFTLLNPALYLYHAQSPLPTALEWAAGHGFERTVRYALDAGISPNKAYNQDWLPLALACIHGHEGVVRILLKHGVDLNADVEWGNFDDNDDRFESEDYGYPAALAARRGHESIMKLLLEFDTPIDDETERGDTPLGMAAGAGHLSMVKLLVEEGCEIDMPAVPPLCHAAESGHLQIVRYLLEEADVHFPDEELKARPLYAAADRGHMAAVDILTEVMDLSGLVASGDADDEERAMLLFLCAACGWESMLRQLLQRGCSPDVPIPSYYFFTSIVLKGLSPYDRHRQIITNPSPLAFAAYNGHLGTTRILLEYNASLCEGEGEHTGNPLTLAVSQSHLPIVRALLEHGANPNFREHRGEFILRQAVPSPEIFELLLDQGASLDRKKTWNESLLEKVLNDGAIDVMKILQRRGIFDSLLQDERGDALVRAARGGLRIMECLLEHGYKVTPNSEEAQLALVEAIKRTNTEVINRLYARGLVFDISVVYRTNLLGYIKCPSPDVGKVISTLDTLLAHGVDITAADGPLFNVLDRTGNCKITDIDHNCDNNEVEQYVSLLLDRGADPLQSRRRSEATPLSAAAIWNKAIVHLMLKALDDRGICLQQFGRKILYAQAQAILSDNAGVIPLLRRAYFQKKYEELPRHPS
ncbi:unnamed protein product [Penicillium pancosmium]